MILHLGVVDVPYVEPPSAPRPAPKKPRHRGPHEAHASRYANLTTGDVAEILEARYHVVEIFAREHEADIVKAVEESLVGAVESLLMGGPPRLDAFGRATSSIENMMKQFLSNREMDALGYPGVPTAAAERGVSHRFRHPYKRRAPRPSFVDTGLYQASLKAWVD